MTNLFNCLSAMVILLYLAVNATFADPILNSSNGHYYEVISTGDSTWDVARQQAESQEFRGTPGHLATITSAEENSWLAANLPEIGSSRTWIGAYQDHASPDYSEPAGGWAWVTGEPWEYSNWTPGKEPNNAWPGGEDHAEIWAWGSHTWNDYDGHDGPVRRYVVEYPVEPTDPLPGDANLDGKVDVSDLGILTTNYGTTSGALWTDGDFTGEGVVDVSDLGVLATYYGTGTTTATPEPGTMTLMVFGVLAVLIRRRR